MTNNQNLIQSAMFEEANKARPLALQWDNGICNYAYCPKHQPEAHKEAYLANLDMLGCTEQDYSQAQLKFCADPE